MERNGEKHHMTLSWFGVNKKNLALSIGSWEKRGMSANNRTGGAAAAVLEDSLIFECGLLCVYLLFSEQSLINRKSLAKQPPKNAFTGSDPTALVIT